MLPVFTDFFQTTFIDNFTKFLQPTYITVASIFTILNLLFIFPSLVSHNILFAVGLFGLNPVLQAVLIVVVVLILAYLLLSASSAILAFMTGESWHRSLLGMLLKRLQVREWRRLDEESQKGLSEGDQHTGMTPEEKDLILRRDIARLEKLTRFPQEEEHIGPTALGNVLSATASYTWNHYNMDMSALWPHMEIAIVKANDTELKTRIDNEKTTLDFLVSLAFVLGLFAIEQALVHFSWLDHDPVVLLGSLVALLLALIVYQAAVIKARTWGSVVQIAFDTHRNDVKTLLGMRDFSSLEEERNMWQKVSSWLLWNNSADDVFVKPPSVSIMSSTNVKVDISTSEFKVLQPQQEYIKRDNGTVCGIFYVHAYIQYVLLISNTDISNSIETLKGVHLLISDPRIAIIDDIPTPTQRDDIHFTAEVVPTDEAGKVDALLWSISGLKKNGSTALSYKLPLHVFKATIDNDLLEMEESFYDINTHKFVLKNTGHKDVSDATLKVFDNNPSMQPFPKDCLFWDSKGSLTTLHSKPSEQHCYHWDIVEVLQDRSVKLIFSL